ncbi:MAG TPA: acylphosphatase [Chitinophagaceae bacterium]|jgi:acylphosphatase|nr:acylphosphatase [Chitinophagaceae bacterium]
MPTIHLLIKGKVQGVFYRVSAKEEAKLLSINGWVKNTPAGAVEAVASGLEENLNAFIDWCKKGPPNAEVKTVEVTSLDDKIFVGFNIIRE